MPLMIQMCNFPLPDSSSPRVPSNIDFYEPWEVATVDYALDHSVFCTANEGRPIMHSTETYAKPGLGSHPVGPNPLWGRIILLWESFKSIGKHRYLHCNSSLATFQL